MLGISLLLPFTTFGTFLGLYPLPPSYFPWLAATLQAYGGVAQVLKRWYLRRFGSWL
jgi:P-type Mg2+ transporter